jgi:hypothetical protein
MREELSNLVANILTAQVAAEPQSAEHYFLCRRCGQAIDSRSLAQTQHHLGPGHRRLTEAELTDTHPFVITRCGSKIMLSVQSGIPYALANVDPASLWIEDP